jgi:carboxyl-terminal processing protease
MKNILEISLTLLVMVQAGVCLAAQVDDGTESLTWRGGPHEDFAHGREAFQKVKEILQEKYVNDKISEDDLYEAATQGMLQNIGHQKWDRLLDPSEYAAMQNDFSGQISGVGLELKFDTESGYADIIGILPGTPAEKAGLRNGDQILKVDDHFFKGRTFGDMVNAIRGKVGEKITLKVLRGDKILTKSMNREKVAWIPVQSSLLENGVGIISIDYFMSRIPTLVSSALTDLQSQGAKKIILDLRGNQGGLFDTMITTAGLFIPEGETIVEAVRRGGTEEAVKASGPKVFEGKQLVVLVNKDTSSSAEMLAGALKEDLGARVVGQTTLGKWNAQEVEDLPNGFAIRYTVSVFKTPHGEELNGKGLEPDVTVDMDSATMEKASHMKSVTERLAADVQLRTAMGLLN